MNSRIILSNTQALINYKWLPISLIIITWLIMVLLVNPIGNFPLCDDWAYASSVKILLETGHFVLHDWSAANILSQAVVGYIFSLIFGFSHTALRFSTLSLALLGLIFVYKLLIELKISRGLALIIVLMLEMNPMFLALSNTFMSDIPFFCFFSIALYYLIESINSNSWKSILLGTLMSGIAILDRQIGLAIPLAFSISYLIGKELTPTSIAKAITPLIISVIIYQSFKNFIVSGENPPSHYGAQIQYILNVLQLPIDKIIKILAINCIKIVVFSGIFLSPLLLYIFYYNKLKITKTALTTVLISYVILYIICYFTYPLTPHKQWLFIGNIINIYGIGQSLSPFYPTSQEYFSYFLLTKILDFISFCFGCLLVAFIYKTIALLKNRIFNKNSNKTNIPVFFALTLFIYLIPIITQSYFFDRYLIIFFLLISMLLASTLITNDTSILSKPHTNIIITILSSFGIISVLLVHDYLDVNRVNWHVLSDLIDNKKIDGGFEFNGTHHYFSKNLGSRVILDGWRFDCFWCIGDDIKYRVSLTDYDPYGMKEYQLDSTYPTHHWLPISAKQIYLLHKNIN